MLEATVDRLWVVRNGAVTPYDGDLDSYGEESLAERRKQASAAKANGAQAELKRSREEERRQTAQRRTELAPLRKKMTEREKRVEALQKKIASIDEALGDHSLYERAPDKARALTLDRAGVAKDLKLAEDEWFEASLAYEEAEGAA